MNSSDFDAVVVGGGIHGCGTARELSLRGLRVLLVEKQDFGAETTAWSTRLIHGGLRYLETGQIGLVKEALREREALLNNASHLVKPAKIAIPIYKSIGRSKSLIKLGMTAYDLLSLGKTLPSHQILSADAGRSLVPNILEDDLNGIAVYYDAHVEYTERLCLENALDAMHNGAEVRNHCEVSGFSITGEQLKGVQLRNLRDGTKQFINTRIVVNAAGPWVENLTKLAGKEESNMISARKGSHVIFKHINNAPDCLLHFESAIDGRPLIIVPWLGMHVVGSTETDQESDPQNAKIEMNEVNYLIKSINGILPKANLTIDDIAFAYSGVRALAFDRKGGSTKTSRRHKIVDHGCAEKPNRIDGLVSLVGGKMTTYRSTTEEIAQYVVNKLGHRGPSVDTKHRPLPGGYRDVINEIPMIFPRWSSLHPATKARLMNTYGAGLADLARIINKDSSLSEIITNSNGILKGEVIYGFGSQLAVTIEDLVARRIMNTWTPSLGTESVRAISAYSAEFLGWKKETLEEELHSYFTYIGRFDTKKIIQAAKAEK